MWGDGYAVTEIALMYWDPIGSNKSIVAVFLNADKMLPVFDAALISAFNVFYVLALL